MRAHAHESVTSAVFEQVESALRHGDADDLPGDLLSSGAAVLPGAAMALTPLSRLRSLTQSDAIALRDALDVVTPAVATAASCPSGAARCRR